MSEMVFFDTYALFEITKGNPAYNRFENVQGIITKFNIAEYNYAMKREGYRDADTRTRDVESWVVEISSKIIMDAMSFRIKNKKLSIPDAIGYITAKHYQCKFLTGDQAFEKMENVEFIK